MLYQVGIPFWQVIMTHTGMNVIKVFIMNKPILNRNQVIHKKKHSVSIQNKNGEYLRIERMNNYMNKLLNENICNTK